MVFAVLRHVIDLTSLEAVGRVASENSQNSVESAGLGCLVGQWKDT